MSGISELAAKLAADKKQADELEAAMASTGNIADEIIGELNAIGAHGKVAQINEVNASLSQARNTRWLAEGHLEEALSVLQGLATSQRATAVREQLQAPGHPKTRASMSESDSHPDPEGSVTFQTDLNGQPLKVTLLPTKPEHEPGPSGEELVKRSQEDENVSGFRRANRSAVRNIDEIQSFVRETAKGVDGATASSNARGTTEAITIQDCVTEQASYVAVPPQPPLNIVDTIAHTLVFAIGAVEASSRIKQRRKSSRDSS